MTAAIEVKPQFSKKDIDLLFNDVSNEFLFAEASAVRGAARFARTEYVRAMASRMNLPQKPIRRRSNFYGRKPNTRRNRANARVWVGHGKKIREKDTPRVLTSKAALSRPFEATMPNGHRGKFVRTRTWVKGYSGKHGSAIGSTQNRFRRGDGQTTYLPIDEPSLRLQDFDSDRILNRACTGAMKSRYQQLLAKEVVTRTNRIRRKRDKSRR